MRHFKDCFMRKQTDYKSAIKNRRSKRNTSLTTIITLLLAGAGLWITRQSQPSSQPQSPQSAAVATITALPIPSVPPASATPVITPIPEQLFVLTQDVFSRDCAASDCPEMAAYQFGEYVTVIQAISAPDGIWYGVQLTDTRVVYLPASALSPVSAGTNRAVPTRRVCPSNCTEAKEWGMSAQDAAACGLDRDGDGAACYGD
jgi:hypothetical protein